jgi:GNAT superfamily N-acetyltransferase
MNAIIRPCQRDDLPALFRLYRQLQPEDTTTLEEMARGFAAMTAHPGCELFVAEVEGRVAGAYTLYILPNMTRNGRSAAILENLVVDEPSRGLGRAMLEFAREQARVRGCYKLSLTSNAVRTEAHEFYRRCGMA